MTAPSNLNLRALARSPLVRSLGSLKLAMLLLLTLIVACIVGTVAESRLDTIVAQAYIYDAPWFVAWLIVLCANLVCSVLARYPWKRQQLGFIITHAGIVVLLAGAMVGRLWGVEGHVTLYRGGQPQTTLLVNQTVLRVQDESMPQPAWRPIDTRLRPPTAARPVEWTLGSRRVSVVDYSEQLSFQSTVEDRSGGQPAVHVRLQSPMQPQPVEAWLILGDPERSRASFGPASLAFVAEESSPAAAVHASAEKRAEPNGGAEASASATRERHFVFAKHPEMNVAKAVSGQPSGSSASLHLNETNAAEAILDLKLDGKTFQFDARTASTKALPLTGTAWSIEGLRYLPDFRMKSREPVSVSDVPNNPAVVFELVSTAGTSDGCTDHAEDCGGDHSAAKSCCPKEAAAPKIPAEGAGWTLVYRADGTLGYYSFAKGQKLGEGTLEIGTPRSTALGGWTLTADKLLRHAAARQEWAPAPDGTPDSALRSGVLVQVKEGPNTAKTWLPTGGSANLMVGNDRLLVSFGYLTHPLGFQVSLDKFEVERNEGTDTPAGFKSHVRFADPARKQTLQREVWMNHPAIFPDFRGASLLGTSYKFSQASWNPDDLNQTTLQVLRDPGWSLKWIGSLLLCFGLFAMFYLKPTPRRPQLP